MYRETDTLAPATLHGDWERLLVKFRASFRDNRNVLRDFSTARLEESHTTASQLCLSVVGLDAATHLGGDEYVPFLQQLWWKITGHEAHVLVLSRSSAGEVVVLKPPEKTKSVGNGIRVLPSPTVSYAAGLEMKMIRRPPSAGVLSEENSPEMEALIASGLKQEGGLVPAICMAYVSHKYNVDVLILASRKGKISIFNHVRRVAMYLSKELTSLPPELIGKKFGGMTGIGILEAIKYVQNLRRQDPDFDAEIQNHIEYLRDREKAVLWTLRSR